MHTSATPTSSESYIQALMQAMANTPEKPAKRNTPLTFVKVMFRASTTVLRGLAQFHAFAKFAMAAWNEKGEKAIVGPFAKPSLADKYDGWSSTASTGIEGNTPQTQSGEQLNLDMKGHFLLQWYYFH